MVLRGIICVKSIPPANIIPIGNKKGWDRVKPIRGIGGAYDIMIRLGVRVYSMPFAVEKY